MVFSQRLWRLLLFEKTTRLSQLRFTGFEALLNRTAVHAYSFNPISCKREGYKNIMGEQNNSGEGEDKNLDNAEGANKGADDTQNKNDGGANGEGSNGDDKGDGSGNGDDDQGGGEDGADKGDGTKKPTQNADEEPTTRKRNVDFIIQRKAEKIAKEKIKADDANKGEDAEDNDDVAPEDAEIIDKRIAKALKPFADKQVQEADKADVDAFVSTNPDFKPYADKVLKWAQHPSRQGIPIESIFYEVAGKDLMKLGAERGKKADEEAKKSGAGGGNNRGGSGGGAKPVLEQTPEEFRATQEAVRNIRRD